MFSLSAACARGVCFHRHRWYGPRPSPSSPPPPVAHLYGSLVPLSPLAVAKEALVQGYAEGLRVMPSEEWVASRMYNPQDRPLVSVKDYF